MPYLESGRGLKLIKKRRFLYQQLVLKLADTHDHILKSLAGLKGEHEIRHHKHLRILNSRYEWTLPLDSFQVQMAIAASLSRLQGLLISGAYGDLYGYELLPKRSGSFEYSLLWGSGYHEHFDPYYYYSYDYPYFGGYYGGYFQSWDVDKVFLELNAELDIIDQEENDMLRYNLRLRRILNSHNVVGSRRTPYYNYAIDLWRIRNEYSKNEWASKIADLKKEGRAGALEQTTYSNLDMGLLSEIEGLVCPEIF